MKRFKIDTTNKSACQYSLSVTERVENVCKPLKEYMGIKCFGYLRIFNDCRYIHLINGYRDFQKHYFSNLHTEGAIFDTYNKNTPMGDHHTFIWPHKLPVEDHAMIYLHGWDIWNGVNIIHRSEDYIEIFAFTFNRETSDQTLFFTRNTNCLIKFVKYFKYKCADLTNTEDKSKLAVYRDKFSIKYSPKNNNREKFLSSLKLGSGFVQCHDKLVNISKREAQCLNFLRQGLSCKSIAIELNLSNKTIEHYIQNLKNKLEINYKEQLIRNANDMDLFF